MFFFHHVLPYVCLTMMPLVPHELVIFCCSSWNIGTHRPTALWRNVRGVTGNALLSRYAASSWRKAGPWWVGAVGCCCVWVGRCFFEILTLPIKLINHICIGIYIYRYIIHGSCWGLELFIPFLDLELTAKNNTPENRPFDAPKGK